MSCGVAWDMKLMCGGSFHDVRFSGAFALAGVCGNFITYRYQWARSLEIQHLCLVLAMYYWV